MKATSKQIALIAASGAVVCSFGIGAFALAQSNPSFDPQNFISSYVGDDQTSTKGYQASPIDADADANRNKDDAENHGKADNPERSTGDAFTNAPDQQQASGTTAYNITGAASEGSIGIVGGAGAGSGAGNGSTGGAGAVVLPVGGNVDNGNGNGGNGGGANGGDQPAPAPVTPWQPTYSDPQEPKFDGDPVLPRKPNTMDSDPVNDSNKTLANVDTSRVSVTIWQTFTREYMLYTGQELDDWTVFCGIEAYFTYLDDDFELQTVEWRCSREQFDAYQKQYFKIVSHPEVVPDEPFPIEVAYRITPTSDWQYETITYSPAPSRTYILGTKLDENGQNEVLFAYPDSDINLFSCNNSLMRNAGYLDDKGVLSQLLLSWQENGQDIDFFYQPTERGRHLISPGRFVDVPDGFTVKFKNVWMLPGYTVVPVTDPDGKPCQLQTLTAVSPSASCMLLPDRYGRITLSTSPGIQAINIEAEPVCIDHLEVSDTVWYINAENDLLRVDDGYSVDAGNPNYANLANGILTDKQETEYLGIPLSFKTLDVPQGIKNVNFTAGNQLQRVTFDAASVDEIPTGNWENLSNVSIVVNDEVFNEFATEHRDLFDISTGNTISMKSDPDTKYRFSNDMLIADDKAVAFADTGVDLVRVTDAHTLTTGCLKECPSIATLVLTDDEPYFFENGCLAGSNVRTIVCSTEEQVEYVYDRLQAAGANDDVYVTCAVTSDEGYRFFDNIDDWGLPAITVFEVPDDTRTFNGVGHVEGYPLAFSTIAPATFQNHPNLAWCNLADTVDHIGANAFSGCSKLQAVFFSSKYAITVGENAFADCPTMRFIASNAMTGNFASDEKPNTNCLMYAPTNCDGYHSNFTSFTEESGVAEYAVDEQEDGSLVLSGCDADGSRWLLLAAGAEMNGDIKLSSDVIEICSNAFADTKGTFTINWEELPNLQYIDAEAFARSGVAGDVYFGSMWASRAILGEKAFSTCPNMTSFTSETSYFVLNDLAFENCTGLEHATLGAMGDYDNAILPGLFSGCTSLQDITFTGWTPIGLTMYGTSLAYLFDSEKTFEEEEATLRLNVPEYAQDAYLDAWLYVMVGSTDYKTYYRSCYKELLKENDDIIPEDYEVKERMSQGLLKAENHLRTMMGMPLVEHSSFIDVKEQDGYVFELQNDAYMLTGVPQDAEVVDFNDVIPEGCDSVGIDGSAFASCSGLKRIVLNDKVSALNMNAFVGCDDVEVELPETVSAQLVGGLFYQPFTFGANVRFKVPESAVDDYLDLWTRQCLGILDGSDENMEAYATNILFDKWDVFTSTELPTADELNEAVNTPLLEQENYLRGLIGLEAVGSFDEMMCYYDASAVLELYQPNPNPDPDPDPWPDLPEWPDWGDDADLSSDPFGGDAPVAPVAEDAEQGADASMADASATGDGHAAVEPSATCGLLAL